MFFSRSRSTQSAHQLLNIPASSRDQSRMLGTPLEHMFKQVTSRQSQKLNAVKELVDVKIKDPIEQDFSNEVEKINHFDPFLTLQLTLFRLFESWKSRSLCYKLTGLKK